MLGSSLHWYMISLTSTIMLEKEMATHSSILAWRTPWTEEPGRLQSMGSQRVRHDWAISLSLYNAGLLGSLLLCLYKITLKRISCLFNWCDCDTISGKKKVNWTVYPKDAKFKNGLLPKTAPQMPCCFVLLLMMPTNISTSSSLPRMQNSRIVFSLRLLHKCLVALCYC